MSTQSVCSICGANYEYRNGRWKCPACGAYKAEELSNEEATLLYSAAQKLRLSNFPEAEEEFSDIVDKYPQNANAYWGRLLAKCGIKYEEDFDGRKIPTCYAASIESVINDNDYFKAIELADEETRQYFVEQAEYIERVCQEWINRASKEKPYDVFICYKDSDLEKGIERTQDSIDAHEIFAKKVCEELENDGNVCWISSRNLRPNDTENYWVNIQRAIESCKIFLVVSSREAMLSKDVKREIEYAKELNKPRLECKIDDVEHTTFFKMFFDGITWIDMQRLDESSFSNLKWRVYSILQPNTKYKPQAKAIGDADWNAKSNLSKARHNVKQRKYDEDAFDFNVEEPTMPLAEAQPKYDVSCFGFEMESGKSINWFDQEIVIDGMEEWIGKGVRITAYNKKNSDVVVIPSEIEGYPVVSIGKEVFAKSRISEIVFPNTIRALLKSAFEDCRNLKKITLPEGLIHIGDNCFNGSGLMEIEIPNSVREIPMFCFANCDIRKAQVGASVRKIGQLAFGRNPITSIKLSEGVEFLDGNCLSATRISGVVIPRSVKEIHPVAFANIDNPQAPDRVTLAVLGMETTVPEHEQFKTLKGVRMVYCLPGSKIEKYAKEHFVMTKPLDDLKK